MTNSEPRGQHDEHCVAADDPEVQRLTTIVDRLPESRRGELMSTLLRAVVTYEGTKDPHVLECFASAMRVTLRLHAADAGYAAALERAAQQQSGRQLSRDEVAALFTR